MEPGVYCEIKLPTVATCIKIKWSVKNGLNQSLNYSQFMGFGEVDLKIHHVIIFPQHFMHCAWCEPDNTNFLSQ